MPLLATTNNYKKVRMFCTKPALLALRASLMLALGLLLSTVLTGCSQESKVRVIRMGHALDVAHPVHEAMVYMAKRVDEISAGRMSLQIYPGGQLGSEREMIELLQIGSLAMTKVSSSPLEGFIPQMKVFSMPYVFRDADHYWKVLNGPIGHQLLLSGEPVKLRGLGYFDAGSRSFYTVDKPVQQPSDLAGLKIRVQNSQTAVRMVRALGGAGTPISWGELYTALQQGVVDGAENNPPSFYSSKHYEVAKFYSLNEHTSVPDIILIGTHVWNKLTATEQRWLQQAMDDAVTFQRQLWQRATDNALQEISAAGVTIIKPEKAPFASAVEPMFESTKDTQLGRLVTEIRQQ
ncbi:TRAP transporter substrate-binding protein [Teredinibacter turnerae]|uniref:TRAP transporter substrate-binding protein n=1 Tax=Teredinibacter turnerae TaxID=2426 RepID=UPI0009E53B40|nr:TRAP transporter substrate-binding protein [Teredinibacter turnerae]